MIWIILTITFYLTSGIFFIGFQLYLYDGTYDDIRREWDTFDTVVMAIAWLPIVLFVLAVEVYSGIREWFNG